MTDKAEVIRGPAVKAAKVQKRVGFHTFRHTYTTLLTQNNEEVKVVQELPTSCE
jgi:site-specific recombinase XerD